MKNSVQTAVPLTELRKSVSGRVVTPEDAGYDQLRTVFYGGIDSRPGAIVLPASAEEVAAVVNNAREHGFELAIRSGGHSMAGHSASNGGVVIDLRNMRGLAIDTERRSAWAETGLMAGEYTSAAGAHGLATGFGDTGSVGIGGITLGGGVGFLVRKYGMTIDNLLAAEMVTADGQILQVNENSHPDLFWAIRGGGGNFGVATRFQYRLQPVGEVLGGMLILPATPDVIARFIEEAEAAPEELSTIANVMAAPPMPFLPPAAHGKLILMVLLIYAGNVEEGQRVVAPLRALAEPIADMLRPMRYPEMFPAEEAGDYHPAAVGYNMHIDRVDRAVAETMLHYIQSSDAPMRVAQLRVLGGAMARVPVEATAYAHRQSRIMVNLAAFYNQQEEKARREAWMMEFADAIRQGDNGVYTNFMGQEGPERVRAAYPGKTWERLVEIKARYDPTNLFHANQNIPPA